MLTHFGATEGRHLLALQRGEARGAAIPGPSQVVSLYYVITVCYSIL